MKDKKKGKINMEKQKHPKKVKNNKKNEKREKEKDKNLSKLRQKPRVLTCSGDLGCLAGRESPGAPRDAVTPVARVVEVLHALHHAPLHLHLYLHHSDARHGVHKGGLCLGLRRWGSAITLKIHCKRDQGKKLC